MYGRIGIIRYMALRTTRFPCERPRHALHKRAPLSARTGTPTAEHRSRDADGRSLFQICPKKLFNLVERDFLPIVIEIAMAGAGHNE